MLPRLTLPLALCLGGAILSSPSQAVPIPFREVQTTFHNGTARYLKRTIDGVDAGREGWSVHPEVAVPHSAIFFFREPVVAGRLRISLCFLSGELGAHFHEFALSTTTDSNPTFQSEWENLLPWLAYSTGTQLDTLPQGRIKSRGNAMNTVFVVESITGTKPMTAIRVDVFPARSSAESEESFVGKNKRNDFLLTELRLESIDLESTNVALGKPVRASHPLWGPFRAEFLTDGIASTFAHPRDPTLGDQFFYEIDFGKVRHFDHFTLRGRSDGLVPERLSSLRLALYDEPTDGDTAPVWIGSYRADGSYPSIGVTESIRADVGTGPFHGRYLRLWSDSPIAYSPQIAELEAYEPLLPAIQGLRGDHLNLETNGNPSIPPGTRWLTFTLRPSLKHLPKHLPIRWRIRGYQENWQTCSPEGLAETRCPPPGLYGFEAQMAHSDGEWNTGTLQFPIQVGRFWWQHQSIQLAGASLLFVSGIGLVRGLARRRLTRDLQKLEHQRDLNEERARIARDMHDVVGARLTQLGVLHEIFAREHTLPPTAKSSLLRLTRTAREVIAALDEVVWAVNPKNDTLANLANYLCFSASEYLQPLDIPCRQDVPQDWPEREVGAHTRHEVLLAFKEALQNIVKHAVATEVFLSLKTQEDTLVIRLADNGKGLPLEVGGAEKDGISNMHARLRRVRGHCQVQSREEGGTVVEMQVPLPKSTQKPVH